MFLGHVLIFFSVPKCYSATLSPVVSFGSTFELQTLDRTHILVSS